MAHFDYHNNYVTLSDMFYESHKSVIEKVCLHLEVEPVKIDEIVEKFIGKKHKVKSLKDPMLPRRPKSAYIYFCKDRRPLIREKLSDAKLPEIAKELGKQWSCVDSEEKLKYQKLSNEDKQRYADEMEKYKVEKVY
tara:strand:- start:946 stop:1353 length:408 start_codon:yes stop_codon:yes gene_type:complete